MKAFKTFTGRVVPLPRQDVDTDMIIPAQYLTSIDREGFGANLFQRLREQDSNFPLNLEKFKGAEILVAGNNFGCGSSREHAVWALVGAGFRVVIAPSFADIFTSNSPKNGLLLINLDQEIVSDIQDRSTSSEGSISLEIDLEAQVVRDGAKEYSFEYDSFRKHCMLNGLDDIDYILSQREQIDSFKTEREKKLFLSL